MSDEVLKVEGVLVHHEEHEELQRYGLDLREIAELVSKYGPTVLAVLSAGLKLGFTKEFLVTALRLFGLDIVAGLVNYLPDGRLFGAKPDTDPKVVGVGPVVLLLLQLLPLLIKLFADKPEVKNQAEKLFDLLKANR